MKKIVLFVAALFAGGFFTACSEMGGEDIDYVGFSYYVWVNDSSHRITLSLDRAVLDNPDRPGFSKSGFEIILEQGESYSEVSSASRRPIPPDKTWTLTVLFDNGTYGADYGYGMKPSEYYDARYDPTRDDNYDRENVKNPNGCSQCAGMRWTYTFTDDDYEAAAVYGERTPGE